MSFVLWAACGSPATPPAPDANNLAAPTVVDPNAPFDDGWVVSSADAQGAPRFVWATTQNALPAMSHVDAAKLHLDRAAAFYSVTPEALATLQPTREITMPSGASVTTFRQEIGGLEVYGSDLSVLLRDDRSLVAISGAPHAQATKGFTLPFGISVEQAIVAAVRDATGELVTTNDRRIPSGRWGTFDLQHASVIASEPIRARQVYASAKGRLRPAYLVETMLSKRGSTDMHASQRLVAADTGAVLETRILTANEAFNYRVWADGTKRPNDDPYANFTPHPTGSPDGSAPSATAPSLISMESFNTAPNGAIDSWLPAAATTTQGNNVDAYTDRFAPDGFTAGQDFYANTTAARTFDRVYDLNASAIANQNQTKAAITHAFYVTNWLHDYWYDSGFDEAGGNAQQNNFGRGGAGNDRMKVEVQDNADTASNNANMSTPADGQAPRMQVFVWSASETRTVRLTPGGDKLAGSADYGPQTFDVNANAVLVVDNTAPTSDACETITNGAALSGKIALIDRGTCNFIAKTQAAQQRGAIGVIIIDNVVAASPPNMTGTGGPAVTIPTLSMTKNDGDALKVAIGNGAVNTRLIRSGGVIRDGGLDSGVVAHEWGHYLHHRLIASCGSQQCDAMSEGWGDFTALHMILRNGDNLGGTYTLAGHAGAGIAQPNSWYWGIRRTAYTIDLAKNPLTFKHIGDSQAIPTGTFVNANGGPNSEVHNAGEIWAQLMFHAYVKAQQGRGTRTFDQVRRAMADYVVAGMAMAPPDATYTEQRDAVLAAAAASSATDFQNLAAGFAARGAGTCATSPPRTSTNLNGVVESFTVAPSASIGNVTADDSRISCDQDGILDAAEGGRVTIKVANTGAGTLADGQLTVSSTTTGVTFPSGTTFAVPSTAPQASGTVLVPINLAATFPQQGTIALTITVTSNSSCTTTITKNVTIDANRDELPNSSTTDTVEASVQAFIATGGGAQNVWSRIPDGTGHAYRGVDLAGGSDTQLVSPSLVVGANAFTMTFKHRHDFESSGGIDWDGGVIEVSQDNGVTWNDASMFGSVAYTGTITNTSGNPLADRQAFTGRSAGYPAMANGTVTFGTALANKTIKIRFRIGTDEAVGAEGWTIDDVGFTGITNKPFRSVVNDTGVCSPPIANAGPDQTVNANANVMLDGSASSDPNNDPLTYTWSQIAGPTVTLSSTSAVKPTFTAPSAAATLQFRLRVSDGSASATDTVRIDVVAIVPDAAVPDARVPDARVPDAAVPDAATPDAAIGDASVPDAFFDGSLDDANLDDAGGGDAATVDGRTIDAPTTTPPGDGGGCCSTSDTRPERHLPVIIAAGLLLRRRRRRVGSALT